MSSENEDGESFVTNPAESNADNLQQSQERNKEKDMPTKAAFYNEWIRPLLAEYFGQLLFAFLHSSAVNTVSNPLNVAMHNNAMVPAFSDGLTVAALIVLIGPISGCHVNFSVTTAVFLGGGMKWMKVPLYLLAQLLGSLSGAAIAYVTNGGAFGQFGLAPQVGVGRGFLIELMMTTFLVLAVLLAAVELNANLAALAIGFTIVIDILGAFNISGGCMNPTLSFGLAVVSGQWTDYWVYWVGPLAGSLMATVIFRLFLGSEARLLFRDNRSSPPSLNEDLKLERGNSSRNDNGSHM